MAPGRLPQLFPWPFVGAVVLLVILIFLTPNLLSTSTPPAGSLATEAELLVDQVPGSNLTHFYVEGLGDVRYAQVHAGVATNLTWPAPASASNVSFGVVTNSSEVLAVTFNTTANPSAVNVTVLYVDANGGAVEYWGIFEFYQSSGNLNVATLAPGLGSYPPTPVTSLPLTILLSAGTPGSVP
jgi:hypothetical protein